MSEKLLNRYLPRIRRQSPSSEEEFVQAVKDFPFEDMARYAYRILEKDATKFSEYVGVVKKFHSKSPWVAQCVAENYSYVAFDDGKKNKYVHFVESCLQLNEWIAGEVADVLWEYLQHSSNLEIFWEIIQAFAKEPKQWVAIEGIGYVVDGLKVAQDKDAFLKLVLETTLENPTKGAMVARGWEKGKDKVEKREGVVYVNPAYDRLLHWEEDKGHFNITVHNDEGIIECRYYNNKQELKMVFEGKHAFNIYNKVHDLKLVTKLDHASWLGHELTRAEIALREGIEFRQDRQLDFSKKWL